MCICTNHLTLYITFGNCHIPFIAAFPLCRTFDFFFATSLFFILWYSYNMLCVCIHIICILVCDPMCRVWRWLCEAEYIWNKIHHVVNVWLFKKYLHIPVHVLIHVDTSPVVIHPWSRDTDTPKCCLSSIRHEWKILIRSTQIINLQWSSEKNIAFGLYYFVTEFSDDSNVSMCWCQAFM